MQRARHLCRHFFGIRVHLQCRLGGEHLHAASGLVTVPAGAAASGCRPAPALHERRHRNPTNYNCVWATDDDLPLPVPQRLRRHVLRVQSWVDSGQYWAASEPSLCVASLHERRRVHCTVFRRRLWVHLHVPAADVRSPLRAAGLSESVQHHTMLCCWWCVHCYVP